MRAVVAWAGRLPRAGGAAVEAEVEEGDLVEESGGEWVGGRLYQGGLKVWMPPQKASSSRACCTAGHQERRCSAPPSSMPQNGQLP